MQAPGLRDRFDFVFLDVAQELESEVEVGLAEPSEYLAIRGLRSATTAEICRTVWGAISTAMKARITNYDSVV